MIIVFKKYVSSTNQVLMLNHFTFEKYTPQ